ncbi:unnamed protein product, partial [Durusdinium trenchii]
MQDFFQLAGLAWMCCNVLHSEAIALQRPTFLDSAIFGQARCAVTGTQMSPPEKERDVEKPFLLFMFFIAGSFTYGALLVYPLYQALAKAKGQEEVDAAQGGLILMVAKYLSIFTHNIFSRCWTTLRGLQLQVSCYLLFGTVSLGIAAVSTVPQAATLMLVASLYFTNSNVIAGPLWPVPSEERSKIRMLFYYACCPAGCLWTALASMCLAREEYRGSWFLRAAVVVLPLLVTLISWLMLPADGFWSPERMKQAQEEMEQQIAEEKRLEEKQEIKKKEKEKKKVRLFKDDDQKIVEEEEEEKGEEEEEAVGANEDNNSGAKEASKEVEAEEQGGGLRIVMEVPPLPPQIPDDLSTLSGKGSSKTSSAISSLPLGLYKKMTIMPPPMEGLHHLPRLSAAARASHRRSRRLSSSAPCRSSRFSARSQESTARRRSTMQQVRATFKDRKTAVARMSFFTPMNPILQRELGSIRYDRPNRAAIYPGPMFDFDFKEFEDPEAEKQSPWRNGRFRVLVGTHCACLYCVTFWGYSVFPMLISEQGPSLELISFLYSLEGAAQVICTILVMPFLDSQIFLKYFSTAFLLLFSAPLAVCLLGKIHWFFYLLTLLLVDVLLCVCNALLGVVVLRSLPWD